MTLPPECFIASEYRYGKIFKTDKTLFIAISQSGETADTLASTLLAKEHGMHYHSQLFEYNHNHLI